MKSLIIAIILTILLTSSMSLVYAVNQTSKAQDKSMAEEKTSTTFLPWQKRNESECSQGCSCQGAVVSCPTETGKIMTIEAGRSGNVITITVNKTEMNTTLEIEQETNKTTNKTKLKTKLSSGKSAEIKIMPDTASEKAIERLKLKVCSAENNCTIQLKEVGTGEKAKLAYEVRAEKKAKVLALFSAKMETRAQIDAETGEVIATKKPWWAFLASEPASD